MKSPVSSLLFILFLSLSSFAQDYEVFVSDAGDFNKPPWQILKFDSNGENPTVFIEDHINWPQEIVFLEDSELMLISNLGSGRITMHDAESGHYLGDFADGIDGPTRMQFGPDSLLYVLQWNGPGIVKRYSKNGTFIGDFTTVGVPRSIGMAWDSAGNLYVSSYSQDLVRKFDKNGDDLGVFVNSHLAGPTNIWFDENGDLLVSDYEGTAVKRFDSSGDYKGDFLTGLNNSEGVAYLPNGNILIGNGATQSVKMFDGDGTYIKDFVSTGTENLKNPNAIALRFLNSTATSSPVTHISDWVYPTTGIEFYLNTDETAKIQQVTIYDVNGQLIHQNESPTDTIWNANKQPNGSYYMHFLTSDSKTYVQKVMVLHR